MVLGNDPERLIVPNRVLCCKPVRSGSYGSRICQRVPPPEPFLMERSSGFADDGSLWPQECYSFPSVGLSRREDFAWRPVLFEVIS